MDSVNGSLEADVEKAKAAAVMLDIRLTDAGYYLRRGKAKTALAKLTDLTRQIRRELEDLSEHLSS